MKFSISTENLKYLFDTITALIDGKPSGAYTQEDLSIFAKLEEIKATTGNLGKAATVEDAKKDIASFTISRSFLGWSLSYIGGDIDTFITDEDAKMLLSLMDSENIKDQAHEVD